VGSKPKTFTLGGEVAVFDRGLISRFEWLRAKPKDEPATPPVYFASASEGQFTGTRKTPSLGPSVS